MRDIRYKYICTATGVKLSVFQKKFVETSFNTKQKTCNLVCWPYSEHPLSADEWCKKITLKMSDYIKQMLLFLSKM